MEQVQAQVEKPPSVKEKKSIASRGIPSSEALWLPPHYGSELRRFQENEDTPTRNVWSLEEVIGFVFPSKYQAKYHETAVLFLAFLSGKQKISGEDTGRFVSENKISKATFYNRVLPRLKRVGMIKVERDTIVSVEHSRKYRPMWISLSKTFGNYLNKIGDSWMALVDDARTRKP